MRGPDSSNIQRSLQVFDRVKGFGKSGAGVGLRLNGFAALRAIDDRLYQAVVKLTSCNRTHVKHTLKGGPGPCTKPLYTNMAYAFSISIQSIHVFTLAARCIAIMSVQYELQTPG